MAKQDEINGYFLEVVRWLKAEHGYTQEYIVKKAHLAQNAISKIKNGNANAGDETITKLCNAFDLNPEYFYGRSPYKSNLEKSRAGENNEPILTADLGKSNPQQSAQVIDPSSMVNAIISAHNSALATKDELIAAKDDTIAGLKRELSTKDELIISLRQQLLQLQQLQRKETSISPFPYPTGVADDKKV
jgi:transcriptional regulator with XRE-family HTH domain